MTKPSLEERKLRMLEGACETCGGSDGSDAEGAPSGDSMGGDDYEGLMKALKVLKGKKKKGKQDMPVTEMVLKASELQERARGVSREERFPLYERVRRIRATLDEHL